jgi:carbon-monoxide dehydrogenase small subunit
MPVEIALIVNGQPVRGTVEPRRSLADFLRESLDLTGTHLGCEHGACGTCTVLVDGAAVRSCLLFAVQAEGAQVVTVVGLARDGEPAAAARSASITRCSAGSARRAFS